MTDRNDTKVGDFVDVTIKHVRQVNHPSARLVRIADEHGDVYDMPPQACVERVAPATWPPRTGDLWRRDDTQDVFFAVDVHDIDETDEPEIVMVCAYEGYRLTPEEFRAKCSGRVNLVYREEEPAEPEPEPAEDGTPAKYPDPGSEIPDQPGHVVGTCGHRVAGSEWRAGFRTCERCHIDQTAGGAR